ncbi:antitoxin Xre/MbcA/ParS toxin-binding domain-containing protein [Phenylobacterium sp.]|uniref:antitoxin Xre/MbcA/ParS toxin-binding domain-containing protein n=1 Tax=Phenylobacterium sp. TaxID=1871053 RepID=UPI0035AEBEB2
MQRVELLRNGLTARDAKAIVASLALPQGRAWTALNVSQAMVNAKARRDQTLSVPEAERVVGVAKLIGQVQQMVVDAGEPEGFSAVAWISSWLVAPLPALGGELPITLLDTMEGQELIAKLLGQIRGGVYA